MLDIATLLNQKLRGNPMWRSLAEKVEDIINATVGGATDEAMNAIGNPYKYLRGDEVDPRSFSEIAALGDGVGLTKEQMKEDRERVANVRVVLPTDAEGNSAVYMDLDGQTYVATDRRFHSRDVLIQEAKLLGFDFFSDDLSDADYARVLLFVSQYWPRAGSRDALGAFLGFIRDIRIDLVQLWTVDDGEEDFQVLERFNNRMTEVWNGGVYYPTSHYDMHYDAFANTDVEELRRLFFALAPIHLVLRRMIETVRSQGVGYISAAPLLNSGKSLRWRPMNKSRKSEQIRYRFVSSNINAPMGLVAPNLEPNSIAILVTGLVGLWMLEKDPYVVAPNNPQQYMRDHGLYLAPTPNPEDRFVFPAHGVWDTGLWFMAEAVNTTVVVEIT